MSNNQNVILLEQLYEGAIQMGMPEAEAERYAYIEFNKFEDD